jgi:hypothetical protein
MQGIERACGMSGYKDIVLKGIGINTTHWVMMYQDCIHKSSVFPDLYRLVSKNSATMLANYNIGADNI